MAEDWNFEEIPESEVRGVPRGRKSNVDPALIDAFRKVKPGKAFRIPNQKLDPSAPTYKTDKARVSATLRAALRSAGHASFSIIWSPDGIPQVKIGK